MKVNLANEIVYGDPPVSRLVTLFWFTIRAYLSGPVTAYRTLILGPIVLSGGLGVELLLVPKQLRHYHSPDDLAQDEWRLSDSEVKCIDLENAASPEEANELEEMTADAMAVHGYYVVAGIARHEYKQGW